MNVMDLFRGLEISNANFQRQTLYIFSHAKLKRKVLAVIPMWITSCLCNLYFSLGLNEKQLWHGIVSNAKNTESVQKDCYYTGFKEVWCTDVTDSGFQDLCTTLEHLSVHFWSPSVSPEPSTAASPFLHGVWTWDLWKNNKNHFACVHIFIIMVRVFVSRLKKVPPQTNIFQKNCHEIWIKLDLLPKHLFRIGQMLSPLSLCSNIFQSK